MTNDEIKDLFDRTNLTLAELSRISGRTVKELKVLLLGADVEARLNPKPAPFGGHRE